MSSSYRLRWHGTESGPHTLSTLQRMLDEHEICIWHEVYQDGTWITVDTLLKTQSPALEPATLKAARAASPTRDAELPPKTAPGKLPSLRDRPNKA